MFKKHEIPRFKERKLHRFQHVLTRRITSFSSNRIFPKQVEKQRYGFQQDGILLALTINGLMLAENIVGKWGFYNQANLAIIILLVTGFSGVSRFNGWKKKGSIKLHSLSAFAALSARWRQKQRHDRVEEQTVRRWAKDLLLRLPHLGANVWLIFWFRRNQNVVVNHDPFWLKGMIFLFEGESNSRNEISFDF